GITDEKASSRPQNVRRYEGHCSSMTERSNMNGKVCLVTGANSGIGKEAALAVARLGATVVIVARDREKGEATVSEIRQATENQNVNLIVTDLSSMKSVRELASTFLGEYPKLHVLINNAGTYLPKRITTADGYEAVF